MAVSVSLRYPTGRHIQQPLQSGLGKVLGNLVTNDTVVVVANSGKPSMSWRKLRRTTSMSCLNHFDEFLTLIWLVSYCISENSSYRLPSYPVILHHAPHVFPFLIPFPLREPIPSFSSSSSYRDEPKPSSLGRSKGIFWALDFVQMVSRTGTSTWARIQKLNSLSQISWILELHTVG